jgi:phytanoyl-CoA hydroxylase
LSKKWKQTVNRCSHCRAGAALITLALSQNKEAAMLNQEQLDRYQQDGFIVIPDFKTPAQIAALRQRAAEIVDAFDPAQSRSIFTTREQDKHIDHYFLDSATRMHCFFEEEAFGEDGQLRQAKALSINKIGHAMHDLDPVFSAFSRGPELAAVARQLGLHSRKSGNRCISSSSRHRR